MAELTVETENLFVKPSVEYRPVPGFPGYRVGDDGSVWSNKRTSPQWRLMRQSNGKGGYLTLFLCRDEVKYNFRVHRLVLLAFVGPCPDGMEACHNDGNRRNNVPSNLRWDTKLGNDADKDRHGTRVTGPEHHNAKLDEVQARTIKQLIASGVPPTPIARQFGISSTSVRNIRKGKTWRHVRA